jgi:hypothetical protein
MDLLFVSSTEAAVEVVVWFVAVEASSSAVVPAVPAVPELLVLRVVV